jgi:hypothetical protein
MSVYKMLRSQEKESMTVSTIARIFSGTAEAKVRCAFLRNDSTIYGPLQVGESTMRQMRTMTLCSTYRLVSRTFHGFENTLQSLG